MTSRRREVVRRPDDPTLSWTAEPDLRPVARSSTPGTPAGFTRSAATRLGDLTVIESGPDGTAASPAARGRSSRGSGSVPPVPPAVRTVLDLTDTVGPSLVTVGDSDGGRRQKALRLAGAFTAMHLSWGLGFVESALFGLPPADSSARLPRHPSRGTARAS